MKCLTLWVVGTDFRMPVMIAALVPFILLNVDRSEAVGLGDQRIDVGRPEFVKILMCQFADLTGTPGAGKPGMLAPTSVNENSRMYSTSALSTTSVIIFPHRGPVSQPGNIQIATVLDGRIDIGARLTTVGTLTASEPLHDLVAPIPAQCLIVNSNKIFQNVSCPATACGHGNACTSFPSRSDTGHSAAYFVLPSAYRQTFPVWARSYEWLAQAFPAIRRCQDTAARTPR